MGDTPTPPAVGHRPSALPHSRGYASRPYEKGSDGLAGGTLTLTLSQRARGSEHLGVKFQISGSFGSIWPRLLLATRLEMRPQWIHLGTPLAHRSLVPLCQHEATPASLGVARSGETFKTVAFSCIWLHSFRLRGTGCEVPVFTGTTEEWPGAAKLLKPSHLVSFRLIPLVDSPQGRRDLQGAGTGTRVGGATAGTESLGRGQAPVVYLGYARDRTG